jgi:hypothetical protein
MGMGIIKHRSEYTHLLMHPPSEHLMVDFMAGDLWNQCHEVKSSSSMGFEPREHLVKSSGLGISDLRIRVFAHHGKTCYESVGHFGKQGKQRGSIMCSVETD